MKLETTLGFLGFGNMGQAIARGLVGSETIAAGDVYVFDADEEKMALAAGERFRPVESAGALGGRCGIVVVATKPQDMDGALGALKDGLRRDALVISIAAGISIGYIEERLGAGTRVVRAMPNTPALVGAGAAGIALSGSCTAEDRAHARAIFNAVGITEEVSEDQIDLMTALVGSGPAYFFYLVEWMVEWAKAGGLGEEQAVRLASQVCYGAGRLLCESGEGPSTLRERVTSKRGTTFAALETFRTRGFGEIVQAGMAAAAARSKELGQ